MHEKLLDLGINMFGKTFAVTVSDTRRPYSLSAVGLATLKRSSQVHKHHGLLMRNMHRFFKIAGDKHTKLQNSYLAVEYDCNHKQDLLGNHSA